MLVLAPAGEAAPTAGPPADYSKVAGVSPPTFKETVKEVFNVPMTDGRVLYVEVTRPKQMAATP